jgi:hypothetical protein
VIDYEWLQGENRWEVNAREYTHDDVGSDFFEMFKPRAVLDDRGTVRVAGHVGRLFVAEITERSIKWPLEPSDPRGSLVPVDRARLKDATGWSDLKQSLLIDVTSMLPLQTDFLGDGTPTGSGVVFVEDPLIWLAPPTSV